MSAGSCLDRTITGLFVDNFYANILHPCFASVGSCLDRTIIGLFVDNFYVNVLHPCFVSVGSCLDRTVNCRSLNLRGDPGLLLSPVPDLPNLRVSVQGSGSITFLATEINHFFLSPFQVVTSLDLS